MGYFLRTFSLLKGQPVYDLTNGLKTGEVCDLCITKTGLVKGLLIKKGAMLKKTFFLAIDQIASFGFDGIMIRNSSRLKKIKTVPEYTFTHQHSINGKMLISRSGDSLGLLEDVYFQEELGTIVGYEVTDGFFTDISEGKHVIKTKSPLTIGKDAIIVDVNDT